jgi:hypothetical protein
MELILDKKDFSPKTLKVYVSIVKRLQKLNFKFPLKKNEKVDYIKAFFDEHKLEKSSTKLDLLNLVIVLRTIEDMPTIKLKDYRGELSKERMTNQVGKMADLKDKLMSVPDYREQLLKAFESGEWKKFIVGYLMLTYGTRNLDTDAIIVKSKKEATDDKTNYLILSKSKVVWIRNHYKTARTFGQQTHIIKDPEFIKAVKSHKEGRLFDEGKMANQLKKILIGGMNEAKVFKALIDEAYDNKDTERINELSKSRGTSIATIKGFYHVNVEDEIIKQL